MREDGERGGLGIDVRGNRNSDFTDVYESNVNGYNAALLRTAAATGAWGSINGRLGEGDIPPQGTLKSLLVIPLKSNFAAKKAAN